MKFLANENFPYPSIIKLRQAGYDITSISEDSPSVTDNEVMQRAINENRTILTFDRDYGELIFKHGYRPLSSVIYFRIFSYLPDEPAHLLIEFLNRNIVIENLFTVIDKFDIRQRKIQ